MIVVAAGALLWRWEKGVLKVLVIHRARYDDWSWPKGKLDRGESVPEAAIREIREETGLRVSLGVKLNEIEYKIEQGNRKVVHYWAAQVTDKAIAQQSFVPDEEVSSLEWLTVPEAKKRLTYKYDIEPLKLLQGLADTNHLETKPLIVLRHAKATPRSDWSNGESTRPLLPLGRIQAAILTNILAAYAPKTVLTSRWLRCTDTVAPFISNNQVRLVKRSLLSERGAKLSPIRTSKLVRKFARRNGGVVICSHRPALPTILDAISAYGDEEQQEQLKLAQSMKPGELYIIHLAKNPFAGSAIVAIESQVPLFED
jgi:8-oxo-dGTP diphosphatase